MGPPGLVLGDPWTQGYRIRLVPGPPRTGPEGPDTTGTARAGIPSPRWGLTTSTFNIVALPHRRNLYVFRRFDDFSQIPVFCDI